MAYAQVREDVVRPFDEPDALITIVHGDEEDYVPRTKQEILEGFRDAVRELKLCLDGKREMQTAEDFLLELTAQKDG